MKISVASLRALILLAFVALAAYGAHAAGETQAPATQPPVNITIHYLGKAYDEPPPLSCTIDSAPAKGTLIHVEIPVQRSGAGKPRTQELVGAMS